MVVFPNAKINLGLKIIKKRQDGYHELETCFYPVLWQDILEIIESTNTKLSLSGNEIPQDGDNIVLKAYRILKSDFNIPPVHIHLHKVIPIGAGLGGGSADAAFTLSLLNNQFSLGLDHNQLKKYAVELGADCVFFIENQPMLATGIGDNLTNVDVSMKGRHVLLVYPNIHISTNVAFSKIIPKKPDIGIKQILAEKNITEWIQYLTNDFEFPVFEKYPILLKLKQQLYHHGAIYASMSGTGSCIYAIFDDIPQINFSKSFKIWQGKL